MLHRQRPLGRPTIDELYGKSIHDTDRAGRGRPCLPRVEKAISQDPPGIHGYLDQEIGTRRFLVGGHFTIADVTVTSFFKSMRQADAAPDAERFPGLARYVEVRCARPAIAALPQAS